VCSLETQSEADKDFLVKLFQEKILELLSFFFFVCVRVRVLRNNLDGSVSQSTLLLATSVLWKYR
jgi:hypothetical protein